MFLLTAMFVLTHACGGMSFHLIEIRPMASMYVCLNHLKLINHTRQCLPLITTRDLHRSGNEQAVQVSLQNNVHGGESSNSIPFHAIPPHRRPPAPHVPEGTGHHSDARNVILEVACDSTSKKAAIK